MNKPKGNRPGDKNYVDPDSKQPCENKGLRDTPLSRIPTEAYKKGWDVVWGKRKNG